MGVSIFRVGDIIVHNILNQYYKQYDNPVTYTKERMIISSIYFAEHY